MYNLLLAKGVRNTARYVLVLIFALLSFPLGALSIEGSYEMLVSPHFALYIEKTPRLSASNNSPHERKLASDALILLEGLHTELLPHIRDKVPSKVVVRFVSLSTFFKETNAPKWTSAIFANGEIRVPFSEDSLTKHEELREILRHEYIHAVAAQLSGYRCPAWLDEGLAQIVEGRFSESIAQAVQEWAHSGESVALDRLEKGFTKLPRQDVAVAYGHSAFAAQLLLKRFGMERIIEYFDVLKKAPSHTRNSWIPPFEKTFGLSLASFERLVEKELNHWASKYDGVQRAALVFDDIVR